MSDRTCGTLNRAMTDAGQANKEIFQQVVVLMPDQKNEMCYSRLGDKGEEGL